MKILFFAGEFSGRLNAANKIVVQLARQLALGNINCYVLGINDDIDIDDTPCDNLRIIAYKRKKNPFALLEEHVEKIDAVRNKAVLQFMLIHPFKALKVAYGYKSSEYRQQVIAKEDMIILHNFFKKNSFDIFITLQEPHWAAKLATQYNLPVVLYQLDPYGLHELYTDDKEQKIITEQHNFEIAKHVFTTPVLLNQYKDHVGYSRFTGKLTAVEFPNVREINCSKQDEIKFNNEYINIVYCGIMEDSYRSPRSFLEYFSAMLLLNDKIRVYFIGEIKSESIVEFSGRYPNNIVIKEPVNLETATAIQNEADVLLNIGNLITNQVPSKIFDYFSLGKPIFSTCKVPNCPSKEYLDRYPLGFILDEYCNGSSAEDAVNFLFNSKGKRLSYQEIKEVYSECTLEHVAQVFKDRLNLDGDGNEKSN